MRYGFFFFVALLTVLPWFFSPGYLLLLDWQGTPIPPALHLDATGGFSGMPIQLLLHLISSFAGVAVAQKIIVLLILASIGYGTALLVQTVLSQQTSRLVPYIAGIFAMQNLFIYNRLQMGHVYLLAGYALTPFAILLVLRFLRKPSIRTGIMASIVSSLVITTSIHHVVLLPLLLAIFIWNEPNKAKPLGTHYVALLVPFVCTAIFLLSIASANPASNIRSLGTEDLFLFAPVAQCSKSVVLDILTLTAQWRNPVAANLPCRQPVIFTAEIVLLCIGILGGAMRNKKMAVGALLFVALSAIPLLPALRDSGKFIGNLAVIQSILLAYGITHLSQTKKYRAWLSLSIVCIAGLPIIWGLSGTIVPRNYPASWYEWDTELATLPEKPRVLFLPWHLYMPFDFMNGAVIGTPAVNFFTHATIIQGDNLEMEQGKGRIATQSNRDISQKVEDSLRELHTKTFPKTFNDLLIREHIRYVAIADGLPEKDLYKAIFATLPYLHMQYDKPGLTIYKFE